MENLRKRINFEVVTSTKVALKWIAKPNFQRAKIFREDLVGIHMVKPVLVMNRPIQVVFAILDLSKYLMYDFHYDTWMEKFPNSTLFFTDTDSLIQHFSSPVQTRWPMKWLACFICWHGRNQGRI